MIVGGFFFLLLLRMYARTPGKRSLFRDLFSKPIKGLAKICNSLSALHLFAAFCMKEPAFYEGNLYKNRDHINKQIMKNKIVTHFYLKEVKKDVKGLTSDEGGDLS